MICKCVPSAGLQTGHSKSHRPYANGVKKSVGSASGFKEQGVIVTLNKRSVSDIIRF